MDPTRIYRNFEKLKGRLRRYCNQDDMDGAGWDDATTRRAAVDVTSEEDVAPRRPERCSLCCKERPGIPLWRACACDPAPAHKLCLEARINMSCQYRCARCGYMYRLLWLARYGVIAGLWVWLSRRARRAELLGIVQLTAVAVSLTAQLDDPNMRTRAWQLRAVLLLVSLLLVALLVSSVVTFRRWYHNTFTVFLLQDPGAPALSTALQPRSPHVG